jgi:hypothetical protein
MKKSKSNAEFIQHSLDLCHKMADDKAGWATWALVNALTETWFNTGRHNRHLNPFPLELCDVREWGLTRMQKSRALRFLVRVKLIAVDRRDPKEPFVTLAWVDRYPSDASRGGDDA